MERRHIKMKASQKCYLISCVGMVVIAIIVAVAHCVMTLVHEILGLETTGEVDFCDEK